MNKDILATYKNEEIDFLLDNGWLFFLITKKGTSRYTVDSNTIQIQKNLINVNIKENSNSFSSSQYDLPPIIKEINNKNEILEHIRYGYNNPELSEQFFYIFYNKYPKYRKELLKETYYYFNVNIKQNLNTFIKNTSKNYSEAVKNILEYPISVLTATTIDLNGLNNKLKLMSCPNDQLFSFWFNFFKARKKQINNHQIAPKVAEFLLNNVSEQQIASFFPFFSYLRAKFETIEPDIFENEYQFTTVLSLNLKKMFDTFCIREYSRHSYAEAIKHFMYGVQEYYYIDYAEDVYENKQRGSLHITFYHNNPQFTVKEGKRLIIDFFNHLKLNHPDTLNISFVSKWLEFDSLNQSLKQKENKLIQKVKKI